MSLMCGCDDTPEIYWEQWQAARKEYYCGECHKVIKPGDFYCRNTAVYDAEFFHHITCEPCQDLSASMMAMGFCIAVGSLLEDHREYIEEYQPPKLERS